LDPRGRAAFPSAGADCGRLIPSCDPRGGCTSARGRQSQHEGEGGASAFFRAQLDSASVRTCNALDDGKAESGAVLVRFRRVEALEDLLVKGRWNAPAPIAHRKKELAAIP